jgi:hypothetical protein
VCKGRTKRPKTKEETVKAFKTYLAITATMLVTAAAAHAGNPTAAQLSSMEIQGQAMNSRCQTSTLSREGYIALCGTKGSQHQPTAAELRAYEIRGEAMNSMYRPTASSQKPAWYRALEIRGQGMQNLSQSSTLSREGFVVLFGTNGAESHPTAIQLRGLEIRGQGMDQLCADKGRLSSDAYAALCTSGRIATGQFTQVLRPSGFHWGDFGIGAASMLGVALVAGGLVAGAQYSRRSGMRSRPAP